MCGETLNGCAGKLKRVAILFYKKVVPLHCGFYSLGNEQNFLSNQKARKLMNVT